jgi:hypothetical protein
VSKAPQGASRIWVLLRSVAAIAGFVSRPSPRLFIVTYAALLLPAVLVLLGLALVLQPLRGDLTRVGGFREAEYGWNGPQEQFDPPLVALQYDRPYDVVVLGDSFSANPGGQSDPGLYWTNYLAQRTGLTVAVLHVFDVTLEELLRHPVYLLSPPRLVLLELVERYLMRDFVLEAGKPMGEFDDNCEVQSTNLPTFPPWRPLPVQTVTRTRDTMPGLDLHQAASYLWKVAARTLLGTDSTNVSRLALTRSDLFSSQAADQLLVHDDDVRKVRHATDQALESAHCKLIAIQNAVQRDGRTRFLFVPVPDKTTVYSEYLVDPQLRNLSRLPDLASKAGVSQVDLLRPLHQAISSGAKDLYMPNDTHWNSTGHRIAAETVVDALSAWH